MSWVRAGFCLCLCCCLLLGAKATVAVIVSENTALNRVVVGVIAAKNGAVH